MPERATIAQVVQLGVESVAGTVVPANKRLGTLQLAPGIHSNVATFRGSGFKYPSVAAIGKEWSEWAATGPMTYTEAVYPLASILGTPTIVQIATTGAYTWTFSPSSLVADTPATFTIEQGDATVRAQRAAGVQFDQFGFTFDRDNFNLTGHAYGLAVADAITMTASPTALGIIPALPKEIDIFLDTTSAGLGTTKLLRVLSGGAALGNRFGQLWAVNSAQPSYAASVELEPSATMNLLVEADSNGMALLSALRDDTTRFLRIKATSAQIAGSSGANPYSFQWDAAVKVVGNDDYTDSNGVYAINWQLQIVHDATWGKAYQAAIVNSQSAL